MDVESIDLDQFKIRVVARTVPGKQSPVDAGEVPVDAGEVPVDAGELPHVLDPTMQVPPVRLLAARSTRAAPCLCSEAEIAALLDAVRGLGRLRPPHALA